MKKGKVRENYDYCEIDGQKDQLRAGVLQSDDFAVVCRYHSILQEVRKDMGDHNVFFPFIGYEWGYLIGKRGNQITQGSLYSGSSFHIVSPSV
jgi:hypothetical protein